MATGWIRAWSEEVSHFFRTGKERSNFRKSFTTSLRAHADAGSDVLSTLAWGDVVELPDGIGSGPWTHTVFEGKDGFVATEHVVEVAYVNTGTGSDVYTAPFTCDDGDTADLLWGDLVQITGRRGAVCTARARGMHGTIAADRLQSEPLLELYFIDVGQGDGVLVRFPSGRHMLIDGGLPRSNQMTGKNAADFVDWKFFHDYGHYAIHLDAMVASHCDYDHYGGLWDLVCLKPADNPELDCIDVRIDEFYHAGLSRWERRVGADPPHRDDLGPNVGGWFVRLLGDRADAEAAVVNGAADELGGYWKAFIADMLALNPNMTVTRLGVPRGTLQEGGLLPRVWENEPAVSIHVLAPVTALVDGREALKDLGDMGQNTNGHSICLRLDYGAARFLLTGDLNKKSMNWLIESYGDRMASFGCDVAKACHHGSADVSYRFLEHVKAGATVILSGDAEGHAHPRPEIVGASAVTGYLAIDRERDRLVTPLVYMTEIERSVALGQVTHIRFRRYPGEAEGSAFDGALFGMSSRDISDAALLSQSDRQAAARAPDKQTANQIEKDAVAREKPVLRDLDARQIEAKTRAEYHYRNIHELFSIQYGNQSVWRSRIMTKNHYGLVNARTDGRTIVCATMKESGDGWTVHSFPARFVF
jgi:beta-lactamase superfamily II metal-dependent hydrolase